MISPFDLIKRWHGCCKNEKQITESRRQFEAKANNIGGGISRGEPNVLMMSIEPENSYRRPQLCKIFCDKKGDCG